MKTITAQNAQTHLLKILSGLSSGEEVLITRSGEPVARLLAVASANVSAGKKRKPGSLKGQIWISDDFDKPDSDSDLFFEDNIFPERGAR